jgi:hypothetical protein
LLAAFTATAFGHNNEPNPTDKPLVWVDSKGKTIGRAVGGGSGLGGAVQLKIEGLSLILPLDNKSECGPGQQFPFGCDRVLAVTWSAGSLVFKDADCKGEAYVSGLTTGSDRAVGIRGQTLYIGDSKPKSTVIFAQSVWLLGACENVPPPPPGFPPQGSLAWKVEKTLGLWTLGFKPPFYLK